jgi:hypothetical protein
VIDSIQESRDLPLYEDRSGGLVAFGVLEIVLGVVSLAMCVLMVVTATISSHAGGAAPGVPAMSLQQAVGTSGFYVALGVAVIWLGIGSIQARRWARTLTLIVAWGWLAMGIFGLVVTFLFLPKVLALTPGAPNPVAVMGCVGIFWGAFFLLLPGAFVLFYRSPNVKLTCEARDPVVRWTDRCPAPVLALILGLAMKVLTLPMGIAYGNVMPLFGTLVTGAPAVALKIAIVLVFAVLAWAVYRLRPAAWWTALGLCIVDFVSTIVTFHRPGLLDEMYRQMPTSSQNASLAAREILRSGVLLWLPGTLLLAGLLYLLWIRRYFFPPASTGKAVLL